MLGKSALKKALVLALTAAVSFGTLSYTAFADDGQNPDPETGNVTAATFLVPSALIAVLIIDKKKSKK